ncbi:general L-amino acid transport system substrate-binding protein [Bosea sp. BE271]|jgi:general L-amino acid transport system substrate-binding protein|nr:general L-amino acid transport system substrate-binding protein [Bosea robiniae]MDR6894820.1 general L-amino acid transport system substrate-binding protein [Bosea sp. BE109]MDR7138136.1 general L-amino acid transport system substrate-binding protein [Bosea sp. BE168]MDR7174835.1 general L-amino acid transport system substrate-binding protein [Bosea sp. BE271]
MSKMITRMVAFGLAAAAFSVFAAPASAQATLEAVRKRGKVLCGVSPTAPGFSYADDKGVRQGFDADVCRAVSSAVFGVPDKVDFVPLNTNVRFQGLQSGEVDLLSRQTTMTFSRDTSLGLDFAPVVFYDGQGLMVSTKLGVKSASELSQSAVCILPGTTTLQNLEDYFKPRNIKYEAVVFENPDEWRNAFFSGRCDVITTDRSDLASVRAIANDPKQYVILPETISKEPLAPVVRQNDSNWRDIVSWTVNALIAAEEYGITKGNIDEQLKSKDPEIQRLLGVNGDLGKMLNVDNKWAYNAIKQLGNYGELFERNLGEKTPLGLTRGPNQLWNKGGLIYSPPFR